MSDEERAQAEDDHSEDAELELSDEAAGQVRGGVGEAVSLNFSKVKVDYKTQDS
jgi:type VI protein secretion system component Hcp